MRTSWRAFTLTVLRFMLIGPFVGAVVAFMLIVAENPTRPLMTEQMAALFLLVLKSGYMLGLIPAALTGAVAGWLRRGSLPAFAFMLRLVVIGAMVSVLLLSAILGGSRGMLAAQTLVIEACAGAAAALVCAAIEIWLRRRSDDIRPA